MMRYAARIGFCSLAVCLTLALAGCPRPPQPPFDASGQYEGVWTTEDGEKLTCDLAMELYQLPEVPIIKFIVAGTVTFSWDCIIPEEIQDLLREWFGIDPEELMPDLVLPVFGQMDRDDEGHLTLGLELDLNDIPDALLQLLPGDITAEDLPMQGFLLAFDGYGADPAESGLMQQYAGDFTLQATVNLGEEPRDLDLQGTFAVDRVGEVIK